MKFFLAFFLCCTFNSQAQSLIKSEDLKADAAILWQALNELHPGLYRHSDSLTIKKRYQELLGLFANDISPKHAYLYFSYFTSVIKCGHTYPNPFNQRKALTDSFIDSHTVLPFSFKIIEQNIIVDQSTLSGLKQGDIIENIDGIPTDQLLNTLIKFVKGDGQKNVKRLKDLEVTGIYKFEYFDILLPLVYPIHNSVKLKVRSNGHSKSITVAMTSFSKRKKDLMALSPQQIQSNWAFEMVDKQTAILNMNTFVTWKMEMKWKKYLDSVFSVLETKNIPNLIIDVRGNEGGNSDVTNYLINKLQTKDCQSDVIIPHLKYKKVSPNLKPLLSTWNKGFYNNALWTKKLNDQYRTIRFKSQKSKTLKRNKKAYKGRTFLLVDAANSSATYILASFLKTHQLATLIGSETGGTKKGITAGQIFFLKLPHSKIEIDIPLIGYYPISTQLDQGVEPDVLVKISLNNHQKDMDSSLEKVKQIIQQSKP